MYKSFHRKLLITACTFDEIFDKYKVHFSILNGIKMSQIKYQSYPNLTDWYVYYCIKQTFTNLIHILSSKMKVTKNIHFFSCLKVR